MIESTHHKLFKSLKKHYEAPYWRKKENRIILEGVHLVEEALKYTQDIDLQHIFICEGFYWPYIQDNNNGSLHIIRKNIWDNLQKHHKSPVPILALAQKRTQPHQNIPDEKPAIILENIQDPGNLGTILRSAKASGIQYIVLSKNSTDAWSPKVLRAGMGAHFGLNIIENAELTAYIKKPSQTLALALETSSENLFNIKLKPNTRFIFGNEGSGLSEQLCKNAALCVKIPMKNGVESLNIAMAATICCFEWMRQQEHL
jgi:TrmH family RNA methyltransferase